MKVGDIVVSTVSFNPFFLKGDKGTIIRKCGGEANLVDFNNNGNSHVYGDGKWYLLYSNCKIVSPNTKKISTDTKKIPLDTRFFDFHAKNPHVYFLFKLIAREEKARGLDHLSADQIGHAMRMRSDLRNNTGEPMKINNSYLSRYARLLCNEDSKFEGLFRSRKLKTVSIL